MLKGDRANGAESGMVFLPDRVSHGTVGPPTPKLNWACLGQRARPPRQANSRCTSGLREVGTQMKGVLPALYRIAMINFIRRRGHFIGLISLNQIFHLGAVFIIIPRHDQIHIR